MQDRATSAEIPECQSHCASEAGRDDYLAGHFQAALRLLWQAHDYHIETGRSPWDFAVEISVLEDTGLSTNDLRWLVCKDLVKHGREVTPAGDDERMFRKTGQLTFVRRTCFILTETGAKVSRELRGENLSPARHGDGFSATSGHSGKHVEPVKLLPMPTWDAVRHELRVGDKLVKQFRRPAVNQETILTAFQEDDWPSRIDDPLPPQAESDQKRRLHDTIKCLNKNQRHNLIHFGGDGTGEGVLWDFTDDDDPAEE